jgi:TP901 family phage tail tape measure protein
MAGRQITLGLLISATGGSRTIAELLALQAAARRIADEAPGILQVSNALGITGQAARQLSQDTGLSSASLGAAATRYRELASAGATLAERQVVLGLELGVTSEQFDRISQSALASRAAISGIAAVAGGVAAGIGAIGNKASLEFSKFDAQLRQFGVIGEASAPQVAALRSEVERLGTSTQKTPTEIAALSIELTKAGFSADAAKTALGGIVLSSQATGEGLARTGEVIGNVINQFGLKAKDTANIADLLTTISNKTASGTNDLGEALSYVGTEAKGSNQSLKDTLLSLGLLADAGIKGSSAGTGLAEALKRLKLASANASTELDDLKSKGSKTAVAAFKTIEAGVRDANGQLKPMPEILKTLKVGLGSVQNQADKDLIGNALFGVQGGRVMNVLLAASAEKVKTLSGELDRSAGASKKAGDALSQGPAAGLKQLEATTSVALVKVGELLQGPFSLLIGVSQNFVSTFVKLPGPIQAAIVATAGFAAILAAATAALAAYKLSQGQLILEQAIAAAGMIAKTGATVASTAATIALSGAERAAAISGAISNIQINAGTIALVAQSVAAKATALATTVMAAASGAAAAVMSGSFVPAMLAAVAAAGPLLLTVGLAVGAIAALSAAFSRSPGAVFGATVEDNTNKLKKLREEGDKPIVVKADAAQVNNLGDSIQRALKLMGEKGPILGLQEAFAGVTNAAKEYGDQGTFITSAQRGNQIAMEALATQAQETGAIVDQSRDIMKKFGVEMLDSKDKARLGASGIKDFTAASEKQIKTIEDSIAILEDQKKAATTNSQREVIQTQIALFESSKASLQKRAVALTGDSEALKTNTDKTKEAAQAQAELDTAIKKINEAATKREKGTKTEDEAFAAIQAAQSELKTLKLNSEQRVSLNRESSEAITKIRKTEIKEIKEALADGTVNEKEAIDRLQSVRSKSGTETAVAKAAASEIIAIRKSTVDAEIATIQAGIAEIDAQKSAGKITEVKAEKDTTVLKQQEIQKRIDLAREEVELTSGNDRTKALANVKKLSAELEKEKAESIKRVKALEQKERDEKLALELAQIKAQIAQVEAAKASGRIDDVEAEKELSALKIKELEKQAKAAEERANAESDPKVREKLKAEADRLNAEVEKAAAESVARILAIKLKAVEEENAKALALVKLSEQERNNEILRGLNTQTTNQEQAQKAKLDTQRSTLEQELEAAQNNQKKLEELEGEITNPKAREEYEKRKLDAATKTAGAIGKLLENEAQQIEFQRQQTIRIIEQEQDARSKAIDLQIAQANKLAAVRNASATTAELASQREIAAIDSANRALQTQGKILEARSRLEKARLDAALFLAEKSGNPEEAAAVKAAQFAAEQTAQQASLAQQIKAEDFANRRAIIEAKINELKAKQAVLTAQQAVAEANLTAAKAKGEADAALAKANTLAPGAAKDKAVADAKQQQALASEQGAAQKANAGAGLEVAKQGAQLAGEAVKEATQNAAASKESQALQQQALNLEQQTAKARFESEQSIARQNALLGQQQATQNAIAGDAERTNAARGGTGSGGTPLPGRRDGGSVSAGTAYLVGEREPEVFIPGVSGTILNQAQITRNLSALQAAQSIGGMGTPTIAVSQNSTVTMGQSAIVQELQALRKLVGDRQPVSTMNATFEAPDSGSFDQFAKLQRSLLRNKL